MDTINNKIFTRRKALFYIYRITNKINGKTYVGQHEYKKLNDNYMESGVHSKVSIIQKKLKDTLWKLVKLIKSQVEKTGTLSKKNMPIIILFNY